MKFDSFGELFRYLIEYNTLCKEKAQEILEEIRKILSGENIKSLMNIEETSEGNKYGYECE